MSFKWWSLTSPFENFSSHISVWILNIQYFFLEIVADLVLNCVSGLEGESSKFYLRIIEPFTIGPTTNDHHFVVILNCISWLSCHFEIIYMLPSIFVSSDCRHYSRPYAGSMSQTTNDIHCIGCWNRCIPTKAKQKFTAEIKDRRFTNNASANG